MQNRLAKLRKGDQIRLSYPEHGTGELIPREGEVDFVSRGPAGPYVCMAFEDENGRPDARSFSDRKIKNLKVRCA